MLRLLLHWILNALALLVVSHFLQGFEVSNCRVAFICGRGDWLLNATVGLFLKVITLAGDSDVWVVFSGDQRGDSDVLSKLVPGFAVRRSGGVSWSAGAGGAASVVRVFGKAVKRQS